MDAQALTVQLWTELSQLNKSDPVYLRLASSPAPQAMLVDQQMLTAAVQTALHNMVEPDVEEVRRTLELLSDEMKKATDKIQAVLDLSDSLAERSGDW